MLIVGRFTNIASLSSIPVTYLEREYGFWQAYLLATVALAVGSLFFVFWRATFVKVEPQGNVLPKAGKTLLCAARNGFKLEHAKNSYQESEFGRSVGWSDEFVEEIRTGLIACRVMYGHTSLTPSPNPQSFADFYT
jgi:POT family proton-dependent oligopeptide transporter